MRIERTDSFETIEKKIEYILETFFCFQDDDIEISAFENSEPANMKYTLDSHFEPLPPPPPLFIPELSAAEESAEERHWRSVVIGGAWRRIDMKVIAPYRKVSA